MGDALDLLNMARIRMEIASLDKITRLHNGVRKKDLEKLQKVYLQLCRVLEGKAERGIHPSAQAAYAAAEAERTRIEKVLDTFKQDFHLDEDGYYVNAEGRRS